MKENNSKPKPQLSLFPNATCQLCGVEVENNIVTCQECAEEWIKSITLDGVSVFNIKK